MAEKERYYCDIYEDIYDRKTDRYPSNEAICDILNDQIERVKNLERENQQLKQSQKQLAVEELEKLKDFFLEPYRDEEMDTDFLITKDAGSIADYVLDRIKSLKGEE